MPQIDTRLVQTAVIGGRDSDQPVILPEEPHNLDEFRRQFGTDRFWCGTLLGGCGEKLMTKRYETKVCHFSHYPDRHGNRSVCGRTANGVDSADHLFIKLHVTRWLADQGHAARAELRSLGHGPGDAVDFWLRATDQHLRFELQPEDYRNWRKAADSLGAKEGHIEWVFGRDGAITRDMVARQGYALRVRCETEGNDRRVLIGTVTENRTVTWAPLEQCRIVGSGLVTPALEELRAEGVIREGGMRNDPFPGSLPLRGAEIVFAVDGETAPPAESPFAAVGRHLVSGFVKPAGSRIIRAHLSLPEAIPVPTEQYVYRLSGVVRLLITDPVEGQGSSWAVRADSLVQLNGLDAERTGLWRPSVALDERLDTAPRTSRTRTDTAPAQPERSRAATMLRQALERVARENTTTTWNELARRIRLDLAHLPDPKRRDLLVEVDKPLSSDRPLLCVLILAGSGRPPSLPGDSPEVARSLRPGVGGRSAPVERDRDQEGARGVRADADTRADGIHDFQGGARHRGADALAHRPADGIPEIGGHSRETARSHSRAPASERSSCHPAVADHRTRRGTRPAVLRRPPSAPGPSRLAEGRRPHSG
ncbi:hypothetical protein [Streptomyces sp. SLBN-8D4]|uniref:hypothetical protein n=1 Tax=Streptomyces sp. SLBN-8D4 TaxID=3377728 RepID=UPI003C79CA51